jgi:hypothetical protein
MKLSLYTLLISLSLLLSSKDSSASHGIGGDITYNCLGNGQYEIKLTLLRDCSGIFMPTTPNVLISNSCGYGSPTSVTLSLTNQPVSFSNICLSGPNTCNGGFNFGGERYIYEGTITLPDTCDEWKFSYTVNSRGGAITTTAGSTNDSLYIFSTMNNTNSLCNNSVDFYNTPMGIYFVSYAGYFYQSANDVDGDSLTYELTTPRTGSAPGDTVQYISGYSASNPLQSSTPVTFDSTDGILYFTPSAVENTIFAVLISEYRNGLLIGQVLRDIYLNVTVESYLNLPPVMSGINGDTLHSLSVCAGDSVNFFISSYDSNTTENVDVNYLIYDSMPGSVIVRNFSNTTNYDTTYFTWRPSLTDVRTAPYCFRLLVHDNHCPYTKIDSAIFCLTVLSPADSFCLTNSIYESDEFTFSVFPSPADEGFHLILPSGIVQSAFVIINTLGQPVFSGTANSGNTFFNCSGLPAGIYEVILINAGRKISRRIIIE